ncbi:MAG: hypothetical protein K0S65_3646 [Labilithrix sp.]|jgi:hypothetical protein|nr:hypothetical protein [Labilithrix sp.]
MATAVPKLRKKLQRATGTHFEHPDKTPTPVAERSFVVDPVLRRAGDAMPEGAEPLSLHRSPKRVKRFIESGGIKR